VSEELLSAAGPPPDPVGLDGIIEAVRAKCERALSGPLAGAGENLRALGIGKVSRRESLRSLWRNGRYGEPHARLIAAARARTGAIGEFLIERRLLVETSLESLRHVGSLRVPACVKVNICREFEFFADPGREWVAHFDPSRYPARAYAAVAILERFPAGQLSWETAGLPRSWLLRARLRDMPGLIRAAMLGLKGFRPAFCAHVTQQRGRIPVLIERACKTSFWRIAQALRLQPEARGIFTSSWLYDPATSAVTPHLAWMRDLFVQNGGIVADIGEAPPDSGFLVGNFTRRRLFASGEYRPHEYAAVWPRDAVIDWAGRHPEYAAEL